MNPNAVTLPTQETPKRTYDVLIEQKDSENISATVMGWQDCQAQGKTREEALQNLRHAITQRLANAEVVSLEIESSPSTDHPWMQLHRMYEDNPLFEEVLQDIQQHRQNEDTAEQENSF